MMDAPNMEVAVPESSRACVRELDPTAAFLPDRNEAGTIVSTRDEYLTRLKTSRRKEPLFISCEASGIQVPKNSTLEYLRGALLNHWYPSSDGLSQRHSPPNVSRPQNQETSVELPTQRHTSPSQSLVDPSQETVASNNDDVNLIHEFDVEGAEATDLLGYDDDDDDDDDGGSKVDEDTDEEDEEGDEDENMGDEEFKDFQRRTRVNETRRAEANRRAGGIKTQKGVVKAWKEFVTMALDRGEIRDEIIDEHHLLLWIKFCAERPKKTRKGIDIPGTFIGASHIKKLYFGALRIRKEQEAEDPSLKHMRPATSVIVWDSLKARMNEALNRVRNGLVPAEDAPDIIANTFLAGITEEQIDAVGKGFLLHSHLHSVINGHLAWTAQNASGNRGDDFRALKLCELQPYTFLHPNGETAIQAVLGLQGEEKAGAGRGMRTKINPVYSAFIAHLRPERCPLGAFAFYQHYIHDVKNISDTMNIDWSVNKSWRQIRVLHGPKSPTTPYNEQSLYNLYVKAFARANFTSGIKAHLPRHILGYQQEKLGIDGNATSKLGWVRGETYFDTYAPALPKTAILGAHGYKTHETYDPVWRHVHVPEQFLQLVCPMAEAIHNDIVGRENLSGAANYWSMVMFLRRYLFLCGAAIFQKFPHSPLFKLPALANPDVQAWMKTDFPTNLSLLKSTQGSPIDLQRIQTESLRLALEEVRSLLTDQKLVLHSLTHKVERRTAVLSPTKSFSSETYRSSLQSALSQPVFTAPARRSLSPPRPDYVHSELDDTGVYLSEPVSESDSGLQAFVNESPKPPSTDQRAKTQVDLILPPVLAFTKRDGPQMIWPPILGQRSVAWDKVYPLIERPEMLWDCWGPRSLDTYTLDEQWTSYNTGELVFNSEGIQTGAKPPLRQVEQFFKSGWRKVDKQRKAWERFREIPEYIEHESATRNISPRIVLDELEHLRVPETGTKLKGLSALSKIIKARRFERVQESINSSDSGQPTNEPSGKRKAPTNPRRPQKRVKS